jgi:hypothetical protein
MTFSFASFWLDSSALEDRRWIQPPQRNRGLTMQEQLVGTADRAKDDAAHPAATLTDRQAIADTITRLMLAIDRRDWRRAGSTLGEQIRTDYTSLFGGSPRTQSASELIDSWRGLLPGFDATQHLTGPIVADVAGDTARARCAVTAVHRIGPHYWNVSGHYDMELRRIDNAWTISAITYDHALVIGDETLPETARARVQQ